MFQWGPGADLTSPLPYMDPVTNLFNTVGCEEFIGFQYIGLTSGWWHQQRAAWIHSVDQPHLILARALRWPSWSANRVALADHKLPDRPRRRQRVQR
jgi:hypothetical protein